MLSDAARVVFWICLWVMAYVLFGHGVLLLILRVFFTKSVKRKPITPSVCFIIPAYNEEADIKTKLENTLRLAYPKEKLRIVVVSDASTDRTDAITRRMARLDGRISLVRQNARRGRAVAINTAAARYKAEVYAISDANVILDENALKELLANFADPRVGAATARFVGLEGKGNPTERGIGKYWDYEQRLRWLESQTGSVPFVSGSFNAVRGELLAPVPADVTHDHYVPADLVQKGFRSVYEPRALAFELPADSPWKEAEIRGRNFLMGVNFMRELPRILSIRRHPWFFLNLVFRKILRWFFPVFLALALISTVFLIPEPVPTLFLGLAALGCIMTALMVGLKNPPPWLSTIGFFGLSQIGLMWGIIRFILGKRIVTWEPPR